MTHECQRNPLSPLSLSVLIFYAFYTRPRCLRCPLLKQAVEIDDLLYQFFFFYVLLRFPALSVRFVTICNFLLRSQHDSGQDLPRFSSRSFKFCYDRRDMLSRSVTFR